MTNINNMRVELGLKREKLIPRRKLLFAEKLRSLLDEYETCLIIDITNIGSKQLSEMRKEFHGKARFLFGKNTLIRKIIRDYVKQYKKTKLLKLMDLIKGNCGLVFTTYDINIIGTQLIQHKKQCSAKIGCIAPSDVILCKGPTNLEPTKTRMFQSMNIETRINRGQIDITCEKYLIKKGDKIGASEALLLSSLNAKPFCYGITITSIYDNDNIINDYSFMNINNNINITTTPKVYIRLGNDSSDIENEDTETDSDDTDDDNEIFNPFGGDTDTDTDDDSTDSDSDSSD